ncbi:proprotein convertase subtilisin/kexin type 5-like [Mercenaria mercenaria]|uniref:proprotein convertase subtilisin/kexin type 5-like n=1 Tax=Mercenaria mercenaria TaxID=6596 RepID=UPI00234E3ED7|nr:proprotein convertase subtilisin/kexin type 5-like [Mercenaria mercenaria]
MTKCPNNAPSASFGNKTCVYRECSENRPFVVNNTCVEKCPNTDQLTFTDRYYGFNYCVKNCEGKYRFNNSCVNVCPPLTVAVNNSCLNHCPSNTSYTCMVKKGYQCGKNPFRGYFDHAVCVNTCPQNMLIWKQSCVNTCPDGLALFGNECADTCPLYYPYKSNSTKTKDCDWAGRCREAETLLKCVRKCPADSYVVNNTCLSHCPYPLLHTNNACVLTCPSSAPFTRNSTLVLESWTYVSSYYSRNRPYRRNKQEKVIQKCINYCADGQLILNLTCVNKCPEDHPYIHNRICLGQLCETQYSTESSFGIICTDNCKPQQFVHNKKCVETCPVTNVLFNRTCVDYCPESHLLTSTYIVGEICLTSCSAQNVIKECVEKCPAGLFELEKTCVEFCHKPLYTTDDKCVESCPSDRPYTVTSSITVAKWSKDGNRYKKKSISEDILKCEAKCPADKVLSGTACANSCPLNSRFITNGKCRSDSCKTKYKFYTSAGVLCFDKCPNDLFLHNDTCYLQCPDNLYAMGQKCINDCPPTHEVMNEETIVKQYYNCSWRSGLLCTDSLLSVMRCRKECPEKKVLHNGKCLDFCLKSTFMFDNACVTKCPESHPFMQPTLATISKWEELTDDSWFLYTENHPVNICTAQCHGDYPLHFENTCFNDCPKPAPYIDQNSCVKNCPGDKMIDIKTKVCVDKCANDRGLFNHSCHYNCPDKKKYIFDAHCVSECPRSHPVAIKENRFICQKSCENEQIFKDGECISKYDCDDPMFVYEGLCLRKCPDAFVWVGSCMDTLGAKIAIAVLGVVWLQQTWHHGQPTCSKTDVCY